MTATLVPSQQILTPQLEIAGGRRLSGELRVSGAKNSALVLMAASLLTNEQLRLRNVPPLTDIGGMAEILTSLGVTTSHNGDTLEMDGSGLSQSARPTSWSTACGPAFSALARFLLAWASRGSPFPGAARSVPARWWSMSKASKPSVLK